MKTRQVGNELKSIGASWQRGAVWMARSGYGDLELSTFMTLRASHAERPVEAPTYSFIAARAHEAALVAQTFEAVPYVELYAAAD